jgi:hypothetical protein
MARLAGRARTSWMAVGWGRGYRIGRLRGLTRSAMTRRMRRWMVLFFVSAEPG